MKYNPLGRTGLQVSQFGFGCGNIGGILVRGDYPTMRRVVSRAIELGVNYFDTAPVYGDGQSEVNLGAVLRELKADVRVGTKVRLAAGDLARIGAAIVQSAEGSLRRLGREAVDLIQLHNHLGLQRQPEKSRLSMEDLDAVIRAFQGLQQQGKVRFWGITGLGVTDALHEAVTTGRLHTIQAAYNLLNPSAGTTVPPGFPFQDFGRLAEHAAQQGMGVIAIRILAGGALSGAMDRHPVASQSVNPIASEQAYSADVAGAQRYRFLVEDGVVSSLVEAAIRFVVSTPSISTALLGISSRDQLEQAVQYVERGPLPADILGRIRTSGSRSE
jgi:aryl-alcohol dehydrogenase-like predicted oxidoreductase